MTYIRVPTPEEIREAELTTGGRMSQVQCAGCSQVVKFIPQKAGQPGTLHGWCDDCRPVDKLPEIVIF